MPYRGGTAAIRQRASFADRRGQRMHAAHFADSQSFVMSSCRSPSGRGGAQPIVWRVRLTSRRQAFRFTGQPCRASQIESRSCNQARASRCSRVSRIPSRMPTTLSGCASTSSAARSLRCRIASFWPIARKYTSTSTFNASNSALAGDRVSPGPFWLNAFTQRIRRVSGQQRLIKTGYRGGNPDLTAQLGVGAMAASTPPGHRVKITESEVA